MAGSPCAGEGRILASGTLTGKSCCASKAAHNAAARPVEHMQLHVYLRHCYPKARTDPSMRAKVTAACSLLDSVGFFTFHSIAVSYEQFLALSLPIGLRNTLIEGAVVFATTGCQNVYSSAHVAEMIEANAKYDEFRAKFDHRSSTFCSWAPQDIQAAHKLVAFFKGIASKEKSIIPAIEAATQLLSQKDNLRVEWALNFFLSRNKLAKTLRVIPKTPEFDAPLDVAGSQMYAKLLGDEGTRGWDPTLDQFKVAPFTYDHMLAYHHFVWHAKYAGSTNTLREGEYFLHTHFQMLTLYRLWLNAYGLPDVESTESFAADKNKTLPPFRGSDQFHKKGGYGGTPIPFRPVGCPPPEDEWCHPPLSLLENNLENGYIKEGELLRHPTLAELTSTKKADWAMQPAANTLFEEKHGLTRKSLFSRKVLTDEKIFDNMFVGRYPISEYRANILAAINDGWKFPLSYKNSKGKLGIFENDNPVWMSISLFGSMVSEVFLSTPHIYRGQIHKDLPQEKINKHMKKLGITTETLYLESYHSYYHAMGGPHMAPEYLNIKDPLFWMWHREIDNLRNECMRAHPKKEDLDNPSIPLGAAAGIQVADVIILEHKDCTSLSDFQKLANNQDAIQKTFLGSAVELKDIAGISDVEGGKFEKNGSQLGDKKTLDHFVLIGANNFQSGFEVAKSAFIPFAWYIRLLRDPPAEGKSLEAAILSIRMFICPSDKIDADEGRWWFELDKWSVEFPNGATSLVVTRSILESAVCMRSTVLMVDDHCKYAIGGEKCDCGIPWNLLLPPGNSDGLDYTLFVMITDAKNDVLEGMKMASKNFSLTMCWGKGKGTPDRQAMGYPFEANPVQKPSEMMDPKRKHIYHRTIKIKRTEVKCKEWDAVESENVGAAEMKNKKDIFKAIGNTDFVPLTASETYFEYTTIDTAKKAGKAKAEKDQEKQFDQTFAKVLFDYAKTSIGDSKSSGLDTIKNELIKKEVVAKKNPSLYPNSKKKCIVQ